MLDGSKVERCEVQVTHTVLIIINNQLGIILVQNNGVIIGGPSVIRPHFQFSFVIFNFFILQFLFLVFQYLGKL